MKDKSLIWLKSEIKTPPFSRGARIRAGFLLRELQAGVSLSFPDSRPMPVIGSACHELRILDSKTSKSWRVMYRIDSDAIIIIHIFTKKAQKTERQIIILCQRRLKEYDEICMDVK